MPTDHEILGIARGANAEEIKRAFRKKVKQYHPDAAQDEASAAAFTEVIEAYGRLSSEESSDRTAATWNPPPVRPTPQSQWPTTKRRPRVHDGLLASSGDSYDVEFYLGPSQVLALQTGDIAIPSRVYERGRETIQTFVVPRGTPHGSILQYAGFKKERTSSANWFDASIRYHWSMVPAVDDGAPPRRHSL